MHSGRWLGCGESLKSSQLLVDLTDGLIDRVSQFGPENQRTFLLDFLHDFGSLGFDNLANQSSLFR